MTVIREGSVTVLLCRSNVNGGHYLSSNSLNLVGGLMSLVLVLASGW